MQNYIEDPKYIFQGAFDRSTRDRVVAALEALDTAVAAAAAAIDALEEGTTLPGHAANHQDGGSDEIATETAAAGAIPKADENGFLPVGFLNPATSPVWVAAPEAADSPGVPGQMAYDGNYHYICVDTDTWLQAAIATWGGE